MTREAIVLAGGLGTRLAGVVADRPKAMAWVAGRPFLEWQLDYLITQRIRRVVLSVGFLADQIVDHFGDRYRDVEIAYVREHTPMGTGGALRLALGELRGHGAFALNGDTLMLADLAQIEGRAEDRLVIGVCAVRDAACYGVVTMQDERVIGFAATGGTGAGWINAGVYWLARDLFVGHATPMAFSFEADFCARLIPMLRPRGQRLDGYFVDVGTPQSYEQAQTAVPAAFADWVRVTIGAS